MTIQEQHVSTSNGSQISTSNGSQISTSNGSQISTSNVSQISTSIEPNVSTSNEPSVNIEPQTTSAAGGTAEDAQEDYKALVEQLMAQNKALIEQNKSLQAQFGILIRSGASVGDRGSVSGPGNPDPLDPVQGMGQPEPKEPYVSLAELGSQIGKRDYGSHNSPQKE